MQLSRKIIFSPPDISDDEINEVVDTLKSGWITTGLKTKFFESLIADFCGTKKSVCLSSATASLELTLRVLGIGPGDEVITSAYTYTASCSVICHVGATPILVDTDLCSFQMDYDKLEKAITKKTKVIIPVDIAGVICDYDKIFDIVERKNKLFSPSTDIQKKVGRIVVVADAAHAFGAECNGKKCGAIADFTSFSFHAVKNLTTGEGGAITWKRIDGIEDEYIYKQFMLLALHGQSKNALEKMQLGNWEYDIITPGFKFNMTDIFASIGIAQIKRYNGLLLKRKQIIERYNKNLCDQKVTVLNHYTKTQKSSGHLYMIRINGKSVSFRNKLIYKMAERGVATNVHYKPLPMFTAYKNLGFNIQDYPNSFYLYKNEITLPVHTLLSDDDIDYVTEIFKECFGNMIGDKIE